MQAQFPGDPGVYNQSSGETYSHEYIDASVFNTSGTDFCTILNKALQQLAGSSYTGGAGVVDARGVVFSTACSTNPWNLISVPSVVLLPAGTIQIKKSWILPSGTKLIGEGGEDPGLSPSGIARTIIEAGQSNLGTPDGMIEMGTGPGCTGVSIENLVLFGNKLNVDGIDNQYCQDASYVSQVSMYEVEGIGLNVTNGSGSNSPHPSGPYIDITFDTNGANYTGGTQCASLSTTTAGIHGMTCTTQSPTPGPQTGIAITAPGNSLEDIRIEGFVTGVSVGTSGVVLRNILGDTGPKGATQVVTVVQIQSGESNIVLMGIGNNCTTSQVNTCDGSNNYTIDDLASGAKLYVSNEPFVAMYALGEQVTSGGITYYSRYTTYITLPNWVFGANPVSGTCDPIGSLYSNTGSGAGLFVCSAVTNNWAQVE